MLKEIINYAKTIKIPRNPLHVILHAMSELGELAEALRKKYDKNFYKKDQDEDGILGEGCDAIITIVDVLVQEGFTEEQISATISRKCEKWYMKNLGA